VRELVIIDERGSSSANEWESMMIETCTARLRDAASLTLSPGFLLDRFLDWVEQASAVMIPVHVKALALSKIPGETRPGPIGD
jgi:hypothetical protein